MAETVKSPLRIFSFSIITTILILGAVLFGLGPQALFIALVLSIIELTFSFDNAIINAKVLAKLPRFWQTIFLTVGIVVAIFGMRIVFPILIVSITADLGWKQVLDLAFNHPEQYAHKLEAAHPAISAFGGAFLLLLALSFFIDRKKDVHWLKGEKLISRFSHWSLPAVITIAFVGLMAALPVNDHASETLRAGIFGTLTYLAIQALDKGMEKLRDKTASKGGKHSATIAAISSLLYLEVLDASFSFDGVIGAFAITSDVILIAAGLGIGAIWVRSFTIYMVRHEFLGRFRFVEHGAHYTVLLLALILLTSVIYEASEFLTGGLGLGIIIISIVASIRYSKRKQSRIAD